MEICTESGEYNFIHSETFRAVATAVDKKALDSLFERVILELLMDGLLSKDGLLFFFLRRKYKSVQGVCDVQIDVFVERDGFCVESPVELCQCQHDASG
ncbi:MAG: hypothetical protein A3B74_03275 [Candidatus Kerfeldbacteria bacterium RIFCSPHIGHO2_02_FULL_42_14]|uniref:Uncharacterized protein n=1 Tax=Candidatus Kerfeldbacteria bacterium RIFCSPHIGHO2_02_FULL_42_14 TaxID=1798540 RepID=A0A1G2AQ64_9BACT|nr:MAG: hypothetical protein A3B74_03275 [Candidatus Kerfeldbacteria bacterium RIFCSPHIGHO2_02_FULL_42_14]OGY80929.1 MAG: hypothetical protein A3E60_03185 [Candidatus Kerfeldbacteria bacterium RIFCSPHIGHO2_12_FULL_42_13]OGY84163.1 MAG: hypothetical protein A3I91_01590 [Candidatus Kerfeldbacteria bacterium RIFCSPLOWO2_02_FULL_42_19]OGY87294.1 MAG: hypothetical protein A3G01_03065 [Candidatus Kerfeldbacteria bacterium RIFCSPLOWO2_12_FULL_43_9]